MHCYAIALCKESNAGNDDHHVDYTYMSKIKIHVIAAVVFGALKHVLCVRGHWCAEESVEPCRASS